MSQTIKMSKNGEDFFDVDPSPESMSAAEAKGYKPYLDMTKNGSDTFAVLATPESIEAATKKGYLTVEAFKNLKGPKKDITKTQSAIRGAEQGLTLNTADEISGGVGAAWDVATTDKDLSDLPDLYRKHRDAVRGDYDEAEKANPKSYLTGEVAGGVTGGLLTGAGGVTLKGSAAFGAAQGLGGSKADLTKGELYQSAIDTGAGAGAGAFGYGAGKTVSSVFDGSLKNGLKTMGRGAKAGAKEAGENALNVVGVKATSEITGAIMGAYKEVIETGTSKLERSVLAEHARKILRSGETGNAGKALSDEEAILQALMSDGDNPIKQWTARKAAALYPGQIDADEYIKLLNMGSSGRTTAREFDKKEAGKSLATTIGDFQDFFKTARSGRNKELNDLARETFDDEGSFAVLNHIDDAITDADSLKSVPGSVKAVLEDVKGILAEGKGTRSQKLTLGAWDDVERGERYQRMQQSRELLDKQINWAKREGLGQAEKILYAARDALDDALKTSPEKVEADALYRASKEVEGKFFKATEFQDKSGNIDVDEFKLAKLLNDTDSAGRFKNSLEDLRAFISRDDLPEEMRAKGAKVVADIEEKMARAEEQRSLSSFRFKDGPSSPAIERMGSKGDIAREAVQSPAGTLSAIDQFNKIVVERLGKNFSELSAEQKFGVTKFYAWMQKNQGASKEKADAAWVRLVK